MLVLTLIVVMMPAVLAAGILVGLILARYDRSISAAEVRLRAEAQLRAQTRATARAMRAAVENRER